MKRIGSNSFVFSMVLAVSLSFVFLFMGLQLAPAISQALATDKNEDGLAHTSTQADILEAPTNGNIQVQYYLNYYDFETTTDSSIGLPTINTTKETVGGATPLPALETGKTDGGRLPNNKDIHTGSFSHAFYLSLEIRTLQPENVQ